MALTKPNRPIGHVPQKAARAWTACPVDVLTRAANGATYVRSPYHCAGDGGERVVRRGKPQSICPRRWRADEARAALRRAVLRGNVSERDDWINDYPRYIWYRDGLEVVYEARLSGGNSGSYHAYPIEDDQVPKGVT